MEIQRSSLWGRLVEGDSTGNSILQHSVQRPAGRPRLVRRFVLNLFPFLILFTSNSTFILMFLTISIISVCPDFKVCRKVGEEQLKLSDFHVASEICL